MILGLDHVAIAVRDPQEITEWYCRHLGFQLVASNDATPPTTLIVGGCGGTMIEVMPCNPNPPVEHQLLDHGIRHLALQVDDFDAEHAHLKDLGVTFVGDIVPAQGGGRVISFLDPEGNVLQIVERPADFVYRF